MVTHENRTHNARFRMGWYLFGLGLAKTHMNGIYSVYWICGGIRKYSEWFTRENLGRPTDGNAKIVFTVKFWCLRERITTLSNIIYFMKLTDDRFDTL